MRVSERTLSIAHVASVGFGRALSVADEAPVLRGRADGPPVVMGRILNIGRRSVGSVGAPLVTGKAPGATTKGKTVRRGGEA